MVCLCGRMIYSSLKTLFSHQSRTISYSCWQRFPVERLYQEISSYNTFKSMIESLSRAEGSAVNLLRARFAGFLGDVTLIDEKAKKDADTLTSEGVLLKSDCTIPRYRMASRLVDELIRNRFIPTRFPNAPTSPLPVQHTWDVDVLGILIESLKLFDKALILRASCCSHKTKFVAHVMSLEKVCMTPSCCGFLRTGFSIMVGEYMVIGIQRTIILTLCSRRIL